VTLIQSLGGDIEVEHDIVCVAEFNSCGTRTVDVEGRAMLSVPGNKAPLESDDTYYTVQQLYVNVS